MRNPSIYLYLSIAIFLVCLTQAGYYVGNTTDEPNLAFYLFIAGSFGVLGGIYTWFANPALITAWYFMRQKEFIASAIYSAIALAISVHFLFIETIMVNEAGGESPITGYGLGYWLWLASQITIFIGAIVCSNKALKAQPSAAGTPQSGAP